MRRLCRTSPAAVCDIPRLPAWPLPGAEPLPLSATADAIALYTKAIDQAPDVATYYLNRAAAYISCGQFSECVADCGHALALEPSNPKARPPPSRRPPSPPLSRDCSPLSSSSSTTAAISDLLP